MSKKDIFAKCYVCGQFIGYYEKYQVDFTPDSEFTIEQTIITHDKCL